MSETIDKLLNVLASTIELAKEISEKVVEERKKIAATNINVIDAAARGNLRETGHSRVLYNLLKNKEIRKDFIKEFLPQEIVEKIVEKIELDDRITEGVDREKQNIDISIFAEPYFIVIENKVNGAGEQEGQIYRYVQYGLENKAKDKDKIYVLYLNKDNHEFPTYYSLTKDGKEGGEQAFSKDMKDKHIIPLSYKDDIYNWINNVYQNEKKKHNEILFSALVQYKDYLEDYFELSNKYEKMTSKINGYLADRLSLSGKEKTEQIKILFSQFKNTSELTNRLGNFMISQLRNEFEEKIEGKGAVLIQKDRRILDYPIFGIEFDIDGIKVQCAAEIENGEYLQPFYGIRCHTKGKVNDVFKRLEECGLTRDFNKDGHYSIWKYCDIDDLVENTYNLAEEIIKIAHNQNSGTKFNL